jgi:hypothetical protein
LVSSAVVGKLASSQFMFDRWIYLCQVSTSHTELLDLKPLPVSSLGNIDHEALYKFSHFNPIQTQVWFIFSTGKKLLNYALLFYRFNKHVDIVLFTWADFSCLVSHRQ